MNDDELRNRFAELRAHDARTAPSFEKTKAAATTRTRPASPLRVILPVTASLAAAAVLLLFLTHDRAPQSAVSSLKTKGGEDVAGGVVMRQPMADSMPLDFLLDTSLDGDERRTTRVATTTTTNTGTPNPIRGW